MLNFRLGRLFHRRAALGINTDLTPFELVYGYKVYGLSVWSTYGLKSMSVKEKVLYLKLCVVASCNVYVIVCRGGGGGGVFII